MYQGGGLKGLSGTFTGQLRGGERAEFVVDEREQLLGRERVSPLDRQKDPGQIIHRHIPISKGPWMGVQLHCRTHSDKVTPQ